MSLKYSFAGKRVLITGGARGIGRQLVQRFHDDGATVFTIDKDPETVEQLQKDLPNVKCVVGDLTDWDSSRKIIDSFGLLDHVVNNAGILIPQPFLEVTKEMANLHFDINALASINVIQTASKKMIKEGSSGTFVNISSIGSKVAKPLASMYGASKIAMEMITRSAAVELGVHNIRVNCIAPGIVDTPLTHTLDVDPVMVATMEKLIASNPIKRTIDPNECVDLVMFLLSPLSAMITGDTVLIDGGAIAGTTM